MSDRKTAQLDDDAAARLEYLLAALEEAGTPVTPGKLMSMAIRMWHIVAAGEAELVLPDEIEETGQSPVLKAMLDASIN